MDKKEDNTNQTEKKPKVNFGVLLKLMGEIMKKKDKPIKPIRDDGK